MVFYTLRAALMRIMRIMRIMRVAVGAPMSNNHPCGNSSPAPYHTAASKPSGYKHDLPRRSPSGRRRAPPSSSYKSYKSYVSVTPPQTAYRRCYQVARHTTEATFSPEPNHTAAPQALGVYRDAPFCQTSQTGQTSQTQASRHRDTHTPADIKQAKHTPSATLVPRCHQKISKFF